MKEFIIKNRVAICIVIFLILAVIGIMIYTNGNNISNNRIYNLAYSKEKFPQNFVDKEIYDLIIGKQNINAINMEQSAISQSDAIEKVMNYLDIKEEQEANIDVKYENKYAYMIQVEDDLYNNYIYTVFKKSAFDIESNTIYMTNKEDVKNILNIFYINNVGKNIVKSEMTDNMYVLYYIDISYGDWGLNDQIYYKKLEIKLDNNNGTIMVDTPRADLYNGTLIKNINGKFNNEIY